MGHARCKTGTGLPVSANDNSLRRNKKVRSKLRASFHKYFLQFVRTGGVRVSGRGVRRRLLFLLFLLVFSFISPHLILISRTPGKHQRRSRTAMPGSTLVHRGRRRIALTPLVSVEHCPREGIPRRVRLDPIRDDHIMNAALKQMNALGIKRGGQHPRQKRGRDAWP